MWKIFSRKRAAFTLTETMVVLSIGFVLFGISIAYNRSSNDQLVLFTEQARLVGFLNRAKSFALEKRAGLVDICAVGVHYQPPAGDNPGSFIMFQDLAEGDEDCPDGANGVFDDPAERKEEVLIDQRALIASFPGDIIFEPPYLQTSYSPNYNQLGLAKIEIEGGLSSCAAVGPGGAVYNLECPEDFIVEE